MTDEDRQRWLCVRDDYVAARKLAMSILDANTDEAVVQACTATLMISYERRPHAAPVRDAASQSTTAPAATNGASAPACPKCGGATLPVQKKNPRQPDFRCPVADCDAGVWNGRKGKTA